LSAWNTHLGHGDFTYAGNLDKNNHPVTDNTPENRNNPELNGDAWCVANEPSSVISKLPWLFTIKPVIAQEEGHLVSVKDSRTVNCEIGNMRVVPNITIAKSNNKWPVVQAIGNKIKFSLKLTVSGSNVKDVRVFDLPALGFKYDLGSYAVLKNGVNMPIAEPIYASPGKWLLGDLNAGDVVEMTYMATIQSSVDPGLYKDVAYAFGCQDSSLCTVSSSDRILASSADAGTIDPGVLSPTFVGTKILLADNSVQSNPVSIVEEKRTEIVKTLPKTGANEMWMLVALAFGFAGLIIAKRKN
jgi:LPXTG-motif cell wall-anchored protein